MGFLSGLARPAFSGADGFLAALRDKLERDRLLAAQAVPPGDPAAAMEIRARSAAIDAQRAEAKEQARRARMGGMEDVHQRGLEEAMRGGDSGQAERVHRDSIAGGLAGGLSSTDFTGWGMDRPATLGEFRPSENDLQSRQSDPSTMARYVSLSNLGSAVQPGSHPPTVVGPAGGRVDLGRDPREAAGSRIGAGLARTTSDYLKPPAEAENPADAGRRGRGRALGQQIATIASKPSAPSATDNSVRDAKISKGINGYGFVSTPEDQLLLARAIFAEASGAPADMDSIGAAIINRIRAAGPVSGRPENRRTLGEVLGWRNQYPFYPSEERPNGSEQWDLSGRPQDMNEQDRAAWEHAQKAAARVLSGRFRDPTHGSTFYFASRTFDGSARSAPDATFRDGIANGTFIPSDYRSPYPRRAEPDPRPTYFFDHIQDRPPKR